MLDGASPKDTLGRKGKRKSFKARIRFSYSQLPGSAEAYRKGFGIDVLIN